MPCRLALSFIILFVSAINSAEDQAAAVMERRTKNLLISPNVPPADPALSASIRPYQNSRRAIFVGFKDRPDTAIKHGEDEEYRGMYILTRFADSAQVHYVAQPMAMREQLTYCDEPVKECYPATASFREAMVAESNISDSMHDENTADPNHDGHLFVFGQDRGGDENTSYYLYHSGGRTSKLQLHDDDGGSKRIMHRSWAWNNNKPYAAFVSNARDGTHFDLYLVSGKDIARHVHAEQSTENEDIIPTTSIYNNTKSGYLRIKDFDHNHLLVQHYTSVTDSQLFLFTLDENDMTKLKDVTEICEGDEPASVGSSAQIIGGRENNGEVAVAYSSDRDGQYKSLFLWAKSNHMVSHEGLAGIGQEIKPWDVECLAYNQETGDLVAGYNEDGSTMLYHWRHSTTLPRLDKLRLAEVVPALNGLGMGVVAGGLKFASIRSRFPDSRFVVGFSFVSPTSPADAYILEKEYDPNLFCIQYTKSEIGGLDSSTFSGPSLIRYKSFDGLEIPAFVYKPNASNNDSCNSQGIPVLIHPHGGPEGQHRPTYSAFYQFLMNKLNVAIIDPNVRGSNGYGKTFVSLDNGRNREDSVKDIGSLIKWIETEGKEKYDLDPNRIAVWGGSYGGYMCLATLIHFNDKLKCGIDMVGISNFVTFLENTASYRRVLRRVKYGDESDPEMRKFLNEISPLTNADKIRAPLFVCQGKNDPRVPVGEAEQIYKTVKESGLEAWYMLAENEGHGFRKKENIDQYQNAMVQFLQKNLVGESA